MGGERGFSDPSMVGKILFVRERREEKDTESCFSGSLWEVLLPGGPTWPELLDRMWAQLTPGCDLIAARLPQSYLSSSLESRWCGKLSLSLFFPVIQAVVDPERGKFSPPGGSSPPLSREQGRSALLPTWLEEEDFFEGGVSNFLVRNMAPASLSIPLGGRKH